MKNTCLRITFFILLSVFISTFIFAAEKVDVEKSSKKFITAVEKITKELTEEEKAIARFSFKNTFTSLGYSWIGELDIDKAAKELTKDEYEMAVEKAANLAKNPASQGVLKLGKAGEKILKALANTTEKVYNASKKWVNENAEEFDKKYEN